MAYKSLPESIRLGSELTATTGLQSPGRPNKFNRLKSFYVSGLLCPCRRPLACVQMFMTADLWLLQCWLMSTACMAVQLCLPDPSTAAATQCVDNQRQAEAVGCLADAEGLSIGSCCDCRALGAVRLGLPSPAANAVLGLNLQYALRVAMPVLLAW